MVRGQKETVRVAERQQYDEVSEFGVVFVCATSVVVEGRGSAKIFDK